MCILVGILLIVGSFVALGEMVSGQIPWDLPLAAFSLLFVTVGVAGLWPRRH